MHLFNIPYFIVIISYKIKNKHSNSVIYSEPRGIKPPMKNLVCRVDLKKYADCVQITAYEWQIKFEHTEYNLVHFYNNPYSQHWPTISKHTKIRPRRVVPLNYFTSNTYTHNKINICTCYFTFVFNLSMEKFYCSPLKFDLCVKLVPIV